MKISTLIAFSFLAGCGAVEIYQDRWNDIFLRYDDKILKYHDICVEKYGLEPYDDSQSNEQKQLMVNCVTRLDSRADALRSSKNSSNGTTGIYSGMDSFGRPIYKDVHGNVVVGPGSSSSNQTGIYSGTDSFGRPIYKDIHGNVIPK